MPWYMFQTHDPLEDARCNWGKRSVALRPCHLLSPHLTLSSHPSPHPLLSLLTSPSPLTPHLTLSSHPSPHPLLSPHPSPHPLLSPLTSPSPLTSHLTSPSPLTPHLTAVRHSQHPSVLLPFLSLFLRHVRAPRQSVVGVVWGGAPLRVQPQSFTEDHK